VLPLRRQEKLVGSGSDNARNAGGFAPSDSKTLVRQEGFVERVLTDFAHTVVGVDDATAASWYGRQKKKPSNFRSVLVFFGDARRIAGPPPPPLLSSPPSAPALAAPFAATVEADADADAEMQQGELVSTLDCAQAAQLRAEVGLLVAYGKRSSRYITQHHCLMLHCSECQLRARIEEIAALLHAKPTAVAAALTAAAAGASQVGRNLHRPLHLAGAATLNPTRHPKCDAFASSRSPPPPRSARAQTEERLDATLNGAEQLAGSGVALLIGTGKRGPCRL
jgi:hypothetical protein